MTMITNNMNIGQPSVNTNNIQNTDLKEDVAVKPSTLKNNLMSTYQKTTSAFTEYPVKGFKGSKKSNFYEFLAMGTVPFVVGSAMFMAIFNYAGKYFDNFGAKAAKSYGNKMALGVLFYVAAKSLSKKLITAPVKMATGIDTDLKYERHVYSDPKANLKHPVNEYEQHKAFESHDFPRFDVLYEHDPNKSRNAKFDEIARRNGLGENLNASDAEVVPMLKDVISRSSTAKNISSYLWAATGVALAVQTPWNNFFRALSAQNWNKFKPSSTELSLSKKAVEYTTNLGKNIGRIAGSFGRNFVEASKNLWKGPSAATGFVKHAGKALVATAALSTVLGIANTIYGAKHSINKNKNVFDYTSKIVEQ